MSKDAEKSAAAKSALQSLPAQHRKFVQAYLKTFNATQSAREAGYSAKSRHNLETQGYDLLRNSEVRAAVEEGLTEENVDKAAVVRFFAGIMYGSDIADFAPFIEGNKTIEQLRKAGVNTRLIKSISIRHTKDGVESRSIELHDAQSAGREVGKLLGFIVQQLRHSGDREWLDALRGMSDEALQRLAKASGQEAGG